MEKWKNRKATVLIPEWIEEDLIDELMGGSGDISASSSRSGTLRCVELTVDTAIVSESKFQERIESALESLSGKFGEYDAAFVTYWDEFGYAVQ